MKPEMGRRVFVGTMAAGLPLVAAWTTDIHAQKTGATGHDHPAAAPATDAVIDQLVREMGVIHNAALAGPRPEHARALAAHLRTLSAYGKATNMDAGIRAVMRDLVAAQGRDTVLYHEPDKARVRRELLQRGFRVDNRLLTVAGDADYLTRSAMLDELLTRGVTPTFDRLATTVARAVPELEQLAATVRRIQDYDTLYWQGFCESLWRSYQVTQAEAGALCFAAELFALAGPSCVAVQGAAATLLSMWFYYCGGRY